MSEITNLGFLGDDPKVALDGLQDAISHHVIPFLADWWDPASPIPTPDEIEKVRANVRERSGQKPLPAAYQELPELLYRLAGGMRFNRRNYVNIHPSPFLPSTLASFVTAIQNPNNIVEEVSKATSAMEAESVAWMARNLFDLPEEDGPWGNIVSGGTVANMTALLVARDYTYDKLSRPRAGRVGPRGIAGLRQGVVLGSAASHYSIEKSLWFLGLGHENLIRTPVCYDESVHAQSFKEERFLEGIRNPSWRMRLTQAIDADRKSGREELQRFYAGEQCPFALQPLGSEILKTLYSCFEFNVPLIACVLTLGTTDTGTIERVDAEAISVLREEDVFIHVDAASGGFAFISDQVRERTNRLDSVDAFTVDAHKMGLLHYPCGAVVFRHRGFREQIYHEAPYLGPLAPTLEGSRPGGPSAALWLALRTIGIDGYRALINHLLAFAHQLRDEFAHSGQFQVLHTVDLNAMAVAPLPLPGETRSDVNALVRAVRQRALEQSDFLINHDRHLSAVKVFNDPQRRDKIVDIEALRIVITNPLVALEDAGAMVRELSRFLAEAREEVKRNNHATP